MIDMKMLPIGVQDFSHLRMQNMRYVDQFRVSQQRGAKRLFQALFGAHVPC